MGLHRSCALEHDISLQFRFIAQNFQNVLSMTKYPSKITDRILTLLS